MKDALGLYSPGPGSLSIFLNNPFFEFSLIENLGWVFLVKS